MLTLFSIVLSTPKIFASDYGFTIYNIKHLSGGRGRGRLKELDSMLSSNHIYRNNDVRTWAHETTHGINARGRRLLQSKYSYAINTIYILDGRLAVLREPPLTLSQIAQKIPSDLRGQHTYSLYLINQQKYWNKQPLYIFDELSAYTHGSIVGIEYGVDSYSDEWFALDFLGYAIALCELADQTDYDCKELFAITRYYCVWHSSNLRQIFIQRKQYYNKYAQQYQKINKHYGKFINKKLGPNIYARMFNDTQHSQQTKTLTILPEKTFWKEVQ